MKARRLSPIGANTFQVQVDSWEDGSLKGLVTGPALPEPTPFSSLPRLILLLDSLMDLEPEPSEVKAPSPGIRPTLELDILFRQNYSWQGRLRWLEGRKEAVFRSVLELMILIETIFA